MCSKSFTGRFEKPQEYTEILKNKIEILVTEQRAVLEKTTHALFRSLKAGGVWNIFGSGHSHIPAEEAFHRAGGLIPVNAWLEEYLMPHMGPARSGGFERLPGLAQIIFDFYEPKPKEVLTIISNSGINATSIEVALLAKKKGVQTVAITSLEHSKKVESRHSSGKKLYELVDDVINTGGVAGDAAISFDKAKVRGGPLSSLLGIFVINYLSIGVCELYEKEGKTPPVYLSANLPSGDAHNKKLEKKYKGRIKRLY